MALVVVVVVEEQLLVGMWVEPTYSFEGLQDLLDHQVPKRSRTLKALAVEGCKLNEYAIAGSSSNCKSIPKTLFDGDDEEDAV
jgi:hypothetical protein